MHGQGPNYSDGSFTTNIVSGIAQRMNHGASSILCSLSGRSPVFMGTRLSWMCSSLAEDHRLGILPHLASWHLYTHIVISSDFVFCRDELLTRHLYKRSRMSLVHCRLQGRHKVHAVSRLTAYSEVIYLGPARQSLDSEALNHVSRLIVTKRTESPLPTLSCVIFAVGLDGVCRTHVQIT